MAQYRIRTFGDPVLRRRATELTEIDATVAKLAEDMHATLQLAGGLGLAAPQVGVGKRLFVYELDDGLGQRTLVNPVIRETRGEWEYQEGCLSVPGLYFGIVRPKEVHITGFDLDGNEVSIESDELEARLFQHELDHLEGRLLLELLDDEQRKVAMRTLRKRSERSSQSADPV